MSTFADAAVHEDVRYSQVWEDHALLTQALTPVAAGGTVLSLASAGDNVLALLLAEEPPARIVAVDVSPAQTALFELKLAAIRSLQSADEVAAFLGARPSDERAEMYARLREQLSPDACGCWDERPDAIAAGVIGCGLLDRYILGFVRTYMPALVDATALDAFLASSDIHAQRTLFSASVSAIEPAVREFYGRAGLQGRARDETQFAHVSEEDVGGVFWKRFEAVCTAMPARGNFYLEYLLAGGYRDLALGPPYLRAESFELLRARIDRITLVRAELGAWLGTAEPESIDAANLSDVFEYLSSEQSTELLTALAARMRRGGRIAYWNLFVNRDASSYTDAFAPVGGLGERLFAADRVPFYGAFRVDERV
jgi:S-adenosylmethionine-diacylglycerol 3-amino-3-carboxypropyl transferase